MIGNIAQRFPRAQVVQVVQRAEVKPKPSRIDVKQQAVKAEVNAKPVAVRVQIGGLQGPTGPAGSGTGATGPTGAPGRDGQIRFSGHGPPGVIIGASPDDTYVDLDTGDIYKLT